MLEKNNPVLIATPRTGSTVVCKMLFNIAHHKFGSKAHLNQFITISPHYKELFDKNIYKIRFYLTLDAIIENDTEERHFFGRVIYKFRYVKH